MVKSKVSRGIGIINKAKRVFDKRSLTTLYHSFIYPHLSCCIEVWGKAAEIHISKLLKLQKRVMRNIMYNLTVPMCRTSAYQKTIHYQGVKEWNTICGKIDHMCGVHIFKKSLKAYQLNSY